MLLKCREKSFSGKEVMSQRPIVNGELVVKIEVNHHRLMVNREESPLELWQTTSHLLTIDGMTTDH